MVGVGVAIGFTVIFGAIAIFMVWLFHDERALGDGEAWMIIGFFVICALIPIGIILHWQAEARDLGIFKNKYHLDFVDYTKYDVPNEGSEGGLYLTIGGVSCFARYDTATRDEGYIIYKDSMYCSGSKPEL